MIQALLLLLTLCAPAQALTDFGSAEISSGTRAGWVIPTQDLKDSGRAVFIASVTAGAGVTTEAVITLSVSRGFAGGTAISSIPITAGKRLRLQNLAVAWRNATAAIGCVIVRLRAAASGTCAVTSPVVASVGTNCTAATIGYVSGDNISFTDGVELSGANSLCISQLAVGTVVGVDVTLVGFEY